jgi:WD40 repeat protein
MGRNSANNALNSAGGYLGPVRIGVGCARTSLLSRERIGSIVVAIVVLVWFSSDDSSTDPIPMRFAHGEAGVMTLRSSFSPDGKTIATIDTAGRVALWDNEDDWRINRFLDCAGHAWSAAFSPDGRFLAVGSAEPDILVFD